MENNKPIYNQNREFCIVCELPLGSKPITHNGPEQSLKFCTDRCYKTYLKEPDKYEDFEEDLE